MIVKVRKIGNSTGVLLSKTMMEQCQIQDEVNIEVKDGVIIIQPVKRQPREGWKEQFIEAGSLNESNTLDTLQNKFDEEEWTWE